MWNDFYEYMRKAEGMEPMKAMILLTKACMNYVGVSAGYRSMAYYAGYAPYVWGIGWEICNRYERSKLKNIR